MSAECIKDSVWSCSPVLAAALTALMSAEWQSGSDVSALVVLWVFYS